MLQDRDETVSNMGKTTLKNLKLRFDSGDIRFISKSGESALDFGQLEPNDTRHQSLLFVVEDDAKAEARSTIIASEPCALAPLRVDIRRRVVPLKGYGDLVTMLLGIVGLLSPGKFWRGALDRLAGILNPSKPTAAK